MTLRICFTLAAFTLLKSSMYAQNPTIHPEPGIVTWCPDEFQTFEVRTDGAQQTGCTYIWSITNGTINSAGNTNRTVSVKFSDVAGSAVLSVTLTNCISATNTTASRTYAIRSLAGRTPQNARALPTSIPICSTASVNLAVDVMFLLNTGTGTSIPQQRADGYEWMLPAGWKYQGTGGTIRTATEFINGVAPDNGCVGGSATVRAYVNCNSGRKYSAPVSISLARPNSTLLISPPPGFTGASCGKTQPVTFTVTSISCAANYTWVFPSGWAQTPVVTPGNTILITPSGGAADAGTILATANLSCGTQIVSQAFNITFASPAIQVSSAICFSGTPVSINNVAAGINVNWSVTSNMAIVSGQGTSSAVIRAATSYVGEWGTISATVSCPNTTVQPKTNWVGHPDSNTTARVHASSQYGVNPISLYPDYNYNFVMDPVLGATQYNWDPLPPGFVWPNGWAGSTSSLVVIRTASESGYYILACQPQNVCGLSSARYVGINIDGGGGIMMRIASPNPSDQELDVLLGEAEETEAEIFLINKHGKVVYQKRVKDKSHKIITRDFPDGMYVLKILSGKTAMDRQVVIRH